MRVVVALRNSVLDLFIPLCNSGFIRLYDGTRPVDGNTALSGNTLLAELVFGATSFVRTNGVLTANAITQDSSANATGTCTFARILQSDGTTVVMDLGVTTSTPTAGTELQMPTLSITATQPVSATSLVINYPVGA